MNVISTITAVALSLACTIACMAPEPPPEPFHTGPYGPGLEVDLPGDKVELLGASGSVRYNLRMGDSALRIYDSVGVRIGSVAIIEGQLKISERDGSEVCTALEQGVGSVVVVCGGEVAVSATLADGTWTFTGESGREFRVSTNSDALQWYAGESEGAGTFDVEDDKVTLTHESEMVAELTGRSRRPGKERALLLAAGEALTDAATTTDAIAWFSAAWIVVQSLEAEPGESR